MLLMTYPRSSRVDFRMSLNEALV